MPLSPFPKYTKEPGAVCPGEKGGSEEETNPIGGVSPLVPVPNTGHLLCREPVEDLTPVPPGALGPGCPGQHREPAQR